MSYWCHASLHERSHVQRFIHCTGTVVCSAFLSECSSSSARAGISHVCQRSYEKENQQVLLLAQQRQESQLTGGSTGSAVGDSELFACGSMVIGLGPLAAVSRASSCGVIVGVEKYVLLSCLADVAPVLL